MTHPDPLYRWTTWREVQAQPEVWRSWASRPDLERARAWAQQQGRGEVWFCGAGSSAFIGDILVSGLEAQRGGVRFRSVPTTDLVAEPHAFLRDRSPLIVNFGRSGNSAETIGTLAALDALAPDAPRLNITCNPESALAQRGSGGPQHVLILPEATHDSGFAMTCSFSTMLLSALAIFSGNLDGGEIEWLADRTDRLLPKMQDVAASLPVAERIVFVGSGALKFAARESALKVLELTSGKVPALWESTLGFRHGPKSFIQPGTLIVVLKSTGDHARRYDADLIAELGGQFPRERILTLGPDGEISFECPHGDHWMAPLFVAFSQILGVVWSDRMQLNVDNPFEGQATLTRVVRDVKLYEVTA